MAVDKYGITKLYGDATSNFQEWYMDMANPLGSPRLETGGGVTFDRSASDDSWIINESDPVDPNIRIYAYSESMSKQWLNVETTIYSNHVSDTNGDINVNPDAIADYVIHHYARGARHTGTMNCIGCAYKARLIRTKGGTSNFVPPGVSFTKEIAHDAYTSSRTNPSPAQFLEKCGPKGKWIGTKFILYNMTNANGRGRVKLEFWTDEDGMDRNGDFVSTRQNWRKLGETIDNGGWSQCLIDGGAGNPGNVSGCIPLETTNTTGQRQCDEVINVGAGTSSDPGAGIPSGNVIAIRTDTQISKIKWWSGREINPSDPFPP